MRWDNAKQNVRKSQFFNTSYTQAQINKSSSLFSKQACPLRLGLDSQDQAKLTLPWPSGLSNGFTSPPRDLNNWENCEGGSLD